MPKLNHILPNSPIIIDPAISEEKGINTSISGLESITILGRNSEVFIQWIADCWKEEFESDLQSLFAHAQWGEMLTSTLSLKDFRKHLMSNQGENDDPQLSSLLNQLRLDTWRWKDEGVQLILISGCDIRKRRA